jgi:formylglycine-generating enzyme required for sulfatase activity
MKKPEEVELDAKKAELNELEMNLVDKELELETKTAKVKSFESLYNNRVGSLYAELDKINAEIESILAEQSPSEPQVPRDAQDASNRGNDSRSEVEQFKETANPTTERSDDLVRTYRKAAIKLHPDLTTDETEKERRRVAMALVNEAYEKGDVAAIKKVLDEWEASPDSIPGTGIVVELIRVIRRLSQLRTRLEELETSIEALCSTDIYKLYQRHEDARVRGEELLAMLASVAKDEIAKAKRKLAKLKKRDKVVIGSVEGFELRQFTNRIGMRFVLIPAGRFLMGTRMTESTYDEDESDDLEYEHELQHEVVITKPFYMGVYPVTQQEYEQLIESNPSEFRGKQSPVENVSWHEAMRFIKRLNSDISEHKKGLRYRLPTEAEWEYACRAGSESARFFGESAKKLGQYAWYDANSRLTTHPVGQKKPNTWGLYDLYGNVWEWCMDLEGSYPEGKSVDPEGPEVGDFRIYRGGSWEDGPNQCRSAYRGMYSSDYSDGSIGFRVAITCP